MKNSTTPFMIALLILATIVSIGVLAPSLAAPYPAGWVRMAVPAILAGGMGQAAYQAFKRGDRTTGEALLRWAALAVVLLAVVVGLGGADQC